MPAKPRLSEETAALLRAGAVIPAHPLALDSRRRLDERRQRALTRYYLAAGAGGVAVGVHTTQFAIHDAKVGLYQPVLSLAAETVRETIPEARARVVRIAGIVGSTDQAVREAGVAAELGYDVGLLSFAGMRSATRGDLIAHARAVSQTIPIMGFYIQQAVGGIHLEYGFWRELCEIENLVAIKGRSIRPLSLAGCAACGVRLR